MHTTTFHFTKIGMQNVISVGIAMQRKPMRGSNVEWSGRMDLNHRPPGPEPGALARLRYAPTDTLRPNLPPQALFAV
jgi:hypothetical protein